MLQSPTYLRCDFWHITYSLDVRDLDYANGSSTIRPSTAPPSSNR